MGLGTGLPLLFVWAVLLLSFLLFFCLFLSVVLLPSFLLFFCSRFFWVFLGPSLCLSLLHCLFPVVVVVVVGAGFNSVLAAGLRIGTSLDVH